jgi:thiamine biosynthesis lipoprotein
MSDVGSGKRLRSALVNRRGALVIIASGTAALLAGKHARGSADPHVWEGTALGAPARLVLYGADRAEARAAVTACLDEIERLERQFSLYRSDSAVSQLNRQGCLEAPPLDLIRLLDLSVRLGQMTGGAFDVTVQPLWQAYADHFAHEGAPTTGPSQAAVAAACARIGLRRLRIASDLIALDAGMALTLNGIAQGYITDRVADLLRRRGWSRILVDMGEMRALGQPPGEAAWSVAIEVPPGLDREPVQLTLGEGAVATSAGYATVFEPTGRSHHLFSPLTGRSAGSFASVTVTAARATLADALSTALYVLPADRIPSVLDRFPGATAYLTDTSGEVSRLAAS